MKFSFKKRAALLITAVFMLVTGISIPAKAADLDINSLVLSVSPDTITVGQQTDVTVTLKDTNETPVSNIEVGIKGVGEHKTTNENGQSTFSVTPNYSGMLGVIIYDTNHNPIREFDEQLFAVGQNECVLNTIVYDNSDSTQNVGNIRYQLFNSTSSRQGSNSANNMYLINPQGSYLLQISADGTDGSYYFTKDITLVPGMNTIELHANTLTKANLSFTLNDSPLQNSLIYLKKNNTSFNINNSFIGLDDENGCKTIYAEPGSYTAYAQRTDAGISTMTFLSKTIEIASGTENAIPINWMDSDTGIVSVNLGISDKNITSHLRIDDFSVDVQAGMKLKLNTGYHAINNVSFDYDAQHYYYNIINDKNFNVSGGDTNTLNIDLSKISLVLVNFTKVVQKGNSLPIYAQLLVGSPTDGKQANLWFNSSDSRNTLNITVTNKDTGTQVLSTTCRSNTNNASIDTSGLDVGTYTVTVSQNPGNLYGGNPLTVSKDFNISDSAIGTQYYDISVDKQLLPLNVSSTVTVTVRSGDELIPNVQVYIPEYNLTQTTDQNGNAEFTINPRHNSQIEIVIGEQQFWDTLFAGDSSEALIVVDPHQIDNTMPLYADIRISGNNTEYKAGNFDETLIGMVSAGSYNLIFRANPKDNSKYYYICQQVDVKPGEIKQVQLDTSQLQEIDLNLKLDGQPISYGILKLRKCGTSTEDLIGYTLSTGTMKLFAAPGNYDININNRTGGACILQYGIPLAQGINDFNYSSSDLQKLALNFGAIDISSYSKNIYLNGQQVDIYNADNSVNISKGDYTVDEFKLVKPVTDGPDISYVYKKQYANSYDKISMGDAPVTFNADVTAKNQYVGIFHIGSYVGFWPELETSSGYFCDCYGFSAIKSAALVKADGTSGTLNLYSSSGDYDILPTDPYGVYTINVQACYGPLYGDRDIVGQFSVPSNVTITLENAKTAYKFGDQAAITIKACNYSTEKQYATLIVAVFDKDNRMVSYGASTQSTNIGQEVELSVMLSLPKTGIDGDYKIKCMVWDSLEGMNPLTKAFTIPIIN